AATRGISSAFAGVVGTVRISNKRRTGAEVRVAIAKLPPDKAVTFRGHCIPATRPRRVTATGVPPGRAGRPGRFLAKQASRNAPSTFLQARPICQLHSSSARGYTGSSRPPSYARPFQAAARPPMDEPEADYLRQQIQELRQAKGRWQALAILSLSVLALL